MSKTATMRNTRVQKDERNLLNSRSYAKEGVGIALLAGCALACCALSTGIIAFPIAIPVVIGIIGVSSILGYAIGNSFTNKRKDSDRGDYRQLTRSVPNIEEGR